MSDDLFTKMCDCEEIQGKWGLHLVQMSSCYVKPLKQTLRPLHFNESEVGTHLYFGQGWRNFAMWGECVWLPSETDLWGMLPSVNTAFQLTRYGGTYELRNLTIRDDTLIASAPTAQQALIQGGMWELHGKKWDGEGWK